MKDIVLSVKHVGKNYKAYKSTFQRVKTWFGINVKPISEFWAVKDISFNLHSGEAIGLIGHNGAGKSTLLKLITGTVRPSKGKIQMHGRVSAILELGIGFNPALTGHENVKQSSGLLGYSPDEIEELLPKIKEFSELGDFFYKQLRTYSSGMLARLAFSVATAKRPEILIVDEVLSVGDAYFQHKSFNRIREFRNQGTALLIVSHAKGDIQSVCDKVILVEDGLVLTEGEPEAVFDYYNAIIADKENKNIEIKKTAGGKIQTISGTGEAKVVEISLCNSKGELIEFAGVGDSLKLTIKVEVYEDLKTLVLGYGIKDRLGQVMYGTNTWHTKQVLHDVKVGEVYDFIISFDANFGVGSYSIQTALVDKDTHLTANYQWKDNAHIFSLVNNDKDVFEGCVWNNSFINIESVEK